MSLKGKGKELRFTRARQAVTFFVIGFALLFAAAWLGVLRWHQITWKPPLLLALAPLPFAIGALWLAWRMTRHAFLILSPIGVEIFPFFMPVKRFQLVTWGEIQHAEVLHDNRLLVLTLAGCQDAKIFIGLDPIPLRTRPLLVRAIEGIAEKRAEAAAMPDSAVPAAD